MNLESYQKRLEYVEWEQWHNLSYNRIGILLGTAGLGIGVILSCYVFELICISCMDTQARTLIIQKGFDLSSSPPQFLDSFEITEDPKRFFNYYLYYNNSISSILKLPGAPKVFKELEVLLRQ
ncbi:140_t:CDS:2 [Diversispora eburnea]|uniref:140_t:CDS:1 n=1 Tax=Diversispora eburnea TaxID=1213867 RepID=A0A9N8ZGU2_9GLOM|nr:140_t:CDS:2 [Diversispora eburnea]